MPILRQILKGLILRQYAQKQKIQLTCAIVSSAAELGKCVGQDSLNPYCNQICFLIQIFFIFLEAVTKWIF